MHANTTDVIKLETSGFPGAAIQYKLKVAQTPAATLVYYHPNRRQTHIPINILPWWSKQVEVSCTFIVLKCFRQHTHTFHCLPPTQKCEAIPIIYWPGVKWWTDFPQSEVEIGKFDLYKKYNTLYNCLCNLRNTRFYVIIYACCSLILFPGVTWKGQISTCSLYCKSKHTRG